VTNRWPYGFPGLEGVDFELARGLAFALDEFIHFYNAFHQFVEEAAHGYLQFSMTDFKALILALFGG
jgi:hypothetical protein